MGSYPTSPRSDFLAWCQAHVNVFTASAAQIGLTPENVQTFKDAVSELADASQAQESARIAARSATTAATAKYAEARRITSETVERIRLFAENAADPSAVYALAQVPPPADPSSLPPPGQPTDMTIDLDPASGALTLRWKCENPRGASGTSYIVRRKLPGMTSFDFLGVTGSKRFTDTTLTAGPDTVQYTVQAQRASLAGSVSSILTVNFGRTGGGGMSGLYSVRIGDGGGVEMKKAA